MAVSRGTWSNAQLAHLGLRIFLGVNIATHGLARVAHPVAFMHKMLPGFAATPLPTVLVEPFLLALPFLEIAIGAAILVGLRPRASLFAGLLLMTALTFGSSLQQQWDVVGLQLIYALAYYVLLSKADDARLAMG